MTWDPRLFAAIRAQPHPLLFVTVSGAHLYGFPSPDSDFDLRGVHLLPPEDVVGLRTPRETIEVAREDDGLELDLVTHDVAKFARLLLRRNGYVLEQLLSPLVLHTTPAHAELVALAPGCVTKHHAHHYVGFAHTQWRLFAKERPPRVKPLLYVYRVLLTGIHLMRSGEVEANLVRLLDTYPLDGVHDLVARKLAGAERGTLTPEEVAAHEPVFQGLLARLHEAAAASRLPDAPTAGPALHDLVVRLRLAGLGAGGRRASRSPAPDLPRVELLPAVPGAAALWHRWRHQADARRFMPFAASTLADLEARVARCGSDPLDRTKTEYRWWVRVGDEVVGTVAVPQVWWSMETAEIAYHLDEAWIGRGVGAAAVRALVDLLFTRGGLRRLTATVSVDNPRSIRLLERLGFQREGTMREAYRIEGRLVDQHVYGLLRHEWAATTREG